MPDVAQIGILLGAGASADAGIPTTVEMTDEIIDRMRDPEHVRLLDFIRHILAADLAQRSTAGYTYTPRHVDVERLFASVDLLIDRYEQPWSPFVASWHAGLESFAPTPTVRPSDLFHDLNAVEGAVKSMIEKRQSHIPTRGFRDALGNLVARAIQSARPSDVSSLLMNVRKEMLQSLFDVLRIEDPGRTAYLQPLADLASQGTLTIATLNYDRSIENLAKASGLRCDTGIERWSTGGDIAWSTGAPIRLLKLHGSIDWVAEELREPGLLPLQRIRKVADETEKVGRRPAVVFGEAGKLRAEGPFLELLLAWSAHLREVDNLLVVGYSFRDEHVNELIARWFNADPQRRIVLIDPSGPPADDQDGFGWYLGVLNRPLDGVALNRFEHLVGPTRDLLGQGIAHALVPASA